MLNSHQLGHLERNFDVDTNKIGYEGIEVNV